MISRILVDFNDQVQEGEVIARIDPTLMEGAVGEAQASLERAQAELISSHKLAQSRIEELEVKSERLPQLKNELGQVEAELSRLSGQEDVLRGKRQAGQQLQARVSSLEAVPPGWNRRFWR